MNPELKQAIDAFPIQQWIASRFKTRSINKNKIRITCPHCGYKDAMAVDSRTKSCHCFACDDGGYGSGRWSGRGNLVDLISLTDKVSPAEAIRQIFEFAPYRPLTKKPEEAKEPGKPERLLPDESLPLIKAPANHLARTALASRGLQHLLPSLRICVSGRYAYRWIIPCQRFGELEGFEAKSYAHQKPKSLFPTWFLTSSTFYTSMCWDWNQDFLVITESSFDAETLGCNAIGIYGSVLHPGQVIKLVELKNRGLRRLVWFLDHDAWKKETNSLLRWTGNLFDNYVVRKPKDSDPNDLGRAKCWELVADAAYISSAGNILEKLLL